MAVITGNKLFRTSKRKTQAYKKYPKNVKQMLNISNIYENGIFKIEPGNGKSMYDSCYVFEDINYATKDDSDKTNILLQMVKWLNSMKADFKICIRTESRDQEKYLNEIFEEKNQETYPEIAEGMKKWKQDKMKEGNMGVSTIRYLVITCHAVTYEEANSYFKGMDVQLMRMFGGWKSRIYKIQEEERLKELHNFFHPRKVTQFWYSEEDRKNGMWKNKILPTAIDSYYNFMKSDDQYLSVLFAQNYGDSLDEGKVIPDLTHVTFPSLVTLDYAPVKRKVLSDKLEAAHMNNEKAISNEIDMKRRAGQLAAGISYSKERKRDELTGYQDQIGENNETCFFVGLLVVVTAGSEEELAKRVSSMQHIAEENGVILNTYNARQLKALNTALPFGGRQVDVMVPFLSSSVIALQPYYAQDVQEKGGYIYGRNETTKNLIIGNRKKLLNPHGMIIGHSGSGKSVLIKLTEVSQTLLSTDDDITIIDPQNEFQDICESYGGEFFDFTPKSSLCVNPFEVPREVFYADSMIQEDFIARQSEYAKSFCNAVMRNISVTQEHFSFIDLCVRKMYQKFFRQRVMPKEQVTIRQFREELGEEIRQADEWDARLLKPIYNSLLEFVEGAYDMFAKPSNISMKKRLTVFGLKNVSQNMWEPVMITIMHFLSNRMEYNQELQIATHLIVDEAQTVCKNPSSADMLLKAIVTYRKFGGICTLALQNLTRALENEELRDMFSGCAYKCFLDQGGVDAQALASIQELSDMEFRSLSEEVPGHGVMVWGKKVILLDAFLEHDNILYERFSTNFHEKAEAAQKKTE